MKLVQRCSVVVTEDMPVDPEAHDLQVCLHPWPMSSSLHQCLSSMHTLYESGAVYVIQLQSISSSHSLCHSFAVYGTTTQDHVSMYSQAPRK